MTRPVFAATVALTAAVGAVIGWHIGRPSPKTAAPASSAVTPTPSPEPTTADHRYRAASAPDFDPRQGRPLTAILASIDALRLDPGVQATVDTGRSGEIFALIDSLTPDEIPVVLNHLASLPPPTPDRLLATLLGRWARQNGAAAMEWAATLPAARFEAVRGPLLAGWATTDPRAAWEWYEQAWAAAAEPRHKLEQDFNLLIHAWARHDAPAALDACLAAGTHGTFNSWTGLASLAAVPERREEILTLIAGIADPAKRADAQRSALLHWAASAPAEAAAWLDSHLPEADSNLVWSVAERYGRANPRANADWLLQRTPPDQRDEAFRQCLYQWSEVAADEAAAWLEAAGPTDFSAEILASRFARTDVEKAVSWARRVSAEKRPDALASTLAQAQLAGHRPEVARFAAEADMAPVDFAAKVEAARQVLSSRR
jgi:hypothetical protein